MSRLAIVIPFLGDSQRLEETLVSVLENRPADSEVLVVLCQPYGNPYHLEDEVRFVPGPDRPGWVRALNHGTAAANAPWIHVLCCGATVEEGWVEPALAHFQDGTIGAVAPLVADSALPGHISAGLYLDPQGAVRHWAVDPARPCAEVAPWPVGPHWAAAFYRKAAWEAAGRFAEDVGEGLAMLDFALTLSALGWRSVVEPQCVVRVAAGAQQSAFRRACEAERFYWRWAGVCGPRRLASHARYVAADCLAGLSDLSLLARLAGRLVGLAGFRAGRRLRQRLWAIRQRGPLADATPPSHRYTLRPNGSAGAAAARVVSTPGTVRSARQAPAAAAGPQGPG